MKLIVVFIITIVAGLFIAWRLNGYSPKRRVNRKKNRWHAWGTFDQVQGFIDGDIESLLPDPMCIPYRRVYFPITYTEYVEITDDPEVRKKEWGHRIETTEDGKRKEYFPVQLYNGIEKGIRTITEEVTRIRKTEIHPFVVTINFPISGLTFHLVFKTTIEIFDPMLTLKLQNFLVYFGTELNDAVYPWAIRLEKTLTEGKNLEDSKGLIIEKMLGLRIDDAESITVPVEYRDNQFVVVADSEKTDGVLGMSLKKFLNEARIQKYGMFLTEQSLNIGFGNDVQEIRDIRKSAVKKQEEEKALKDEKKKNLMRLSILDDNRDQKRIKDAAYLKDVGKELAKTQAKALSPLKNIRTLVLNGGKGSESISSLFETKLLDEVEEKEEKEEMIEKHFKKSKKS